MAYDPKKHHRRSIRLKKYDYSQEGAYFITLCAKNKRCLFGETREGSMHLNTAGEMLKRQWENLEHRFLNLHLDQYVIMPNHFHGIIILKNPFFVDQDQKRAHTRGAPTQNTNYSVNEIIRAFKSISAREYADEIKNAGTSFDTQFWQRNYYEHVIRTEESLGVLRKYILENPRRWREDVLFSKS